MGVKPDNPLLTVEGKIKFIDFGAACDLCTQINYSPEYGMLDPRYSPPEELVMPVTAPRLPIPGLAALVGPIIWVRYRPDLFDSYGVGMILLQMAIPQIRSPLSQRMFRQELIQYNNNLTSWRMSGSPKAKAADFSLIDRQHGAGWELACRLVSNRN